MDATGIPLTSAIKMNAFPKLRKQFAFALFLSMLAAFVPVTFGAQTNSPSVARATIPRLPKNVTELKFSEFFVTPIGPHGLTLTDKLRSLDGKRVRMLGYMVHHDDSLPGRFLLSALPVQLHSHDSSDDLPAALVVVSVPTCPDTQVPFKPGLMLLTGTLNVGAHEEADGRMSMVRLALDPPLRTSNARFTFTRKGAEQLLKRATPPRTGTP
jgi:hypothetical protein